MADTRLEFGLCDSELVLIGELLTPDSSRLWAAEEHAPGSLPRSLDLDFVREYLTFVGWNRRPPAPELPVWVEGRRLLAGENPYARVLSGDLRHNKKYATYLPVFYELSAVSQAAGLREFPRWVGFWRVVFLLCLLGTAALIFARLARGGLLGLAMLGASLWLFNRWGLAGSRYASLDFVPVFLLVLSLWLFPRRRLPALLLFGLSLGFKPIGLLLVPLYLVWVWREPGGQAARRVALAALAIGAIPIAASLPFIVWNAPGFFRSILFSVTRNPEPFLGAFAAGDVLGLVGVPAKIPMAVLLLLTYALAWQGKIGRHAAVLLVMVIFVDFNSVLFAQYMIWLVPFVPLAVGEWAESQRTAPAPAGPHPSPAGPLDAPPDAPIDKAPPGTTTDEARTAEVS